MRFLRAPCRIGAGAAHALPRPPRGATAFWRLRWRRLAVAWQLGVPAESIPRALEAALRGVGRRFERLGEPPSPRARAGRRRPRSSSSRTAGRDHACPRRAAPSGGSVLLFQCRSVTRAPADLRTIFAEVLALRSTCSARRGLIRGGSGDCAAPMGVLRPRACAAAAAGRPRPSLQNSPRRRPRPIDLVEAERSGPWSQEPGDIGGWIRASHRSGATAMRGDPQRPRRRVAVAVGGAAANGRFSRAGGGAVDSPALRGVGVDARAVEGASSRGPRRPGWRLRSASSIMPHGRDGEDGRQQGALELIGDSLHRLRPSGLRARSWTRSGRSWIGAISAIPHRPDLQPVDAAEDAAAIADRFGLPCVVKPVHEAPLSGIGTARRRQRLVSGMLLSHGAPVTS